MNRDDRDQKLSRHLRECKRLYESLQQFFPQGIGLEHIPAADQDRQLAVTTIYLLVLKIREVNKLLADAALEGVPQSADRELLQFYRDRLDRERPQLETIFFEMIGLPNVDIDLRQVHPQTDTAPIWNVLVSGLDFWTQDTSGTFSEEELELADRFLYTPFFEPDEWMRNNGELQPIAGAATQRIPSNVRVRVRELYRSFTLGNYLAAIALARAILEYAIVDRAARLGINPHYDDPAHPNRIRGIRALVDEASASRPELMTDMETIVDAGNRTLHPRQQDRLVLFPTALHDLALSSVQAIRSVIEMLYLAAK